MPKYFITKVDKKAVCFPFCETVAVLKEYNISRHYSTQNYGNNLSAVGQKIKATKLKNC